MRPGSVLPVAGLLVAVGQGIALLEPSPINSTKALMWRYTIPNRWIRLFLALHLLSTCNTCDTRWRPRIMGALGGAAEVLLLRQSTLSRCIRQREERIQMIVFERSSGGVRATLAGREFLRAARSIPEQMDMLVTTVHRTGRGEAGRLTIGFYTSLSNGANLAPCGIGLCGGLANLTRIAIRLQLPAILRFRPRAWRASVTPEPFRVRRSGCRRTCGSLERSQQRQYRPGEADPKC
jgi:hypothetical protein